MSRLEKVFMTMWTALLFFGLAFGIAVLYNVFLLKLDIMFALPAGVACVLALLEIGSRLRDTNEAENEKPDKVQPVPTDAERAAGHELVSMDVLKKYVKASASGTVNLMIITQWGGNPRGKEIQEFMDQTMYRPEGFGLDYIRIVLEKIRVAFSDTEFVLENTNNKIFNKERDVNLFIESVDDLLVLLDSVCRNIDRGETEDLITKVVP